MLIIGLGHKARQGKDTFAKSILEEYSYARTYSFAKELKIFCRDNHESLVIKYPFIELDTKPDPIYNYPKMLQYIGTEVERARDPDCWISKVNARILQEEPGIAVITDVRFINEANWIKSLGGLVIDIIRLNPDGTQFIDPSRDPNHASETQLDGYPFDLVIGVVSGNLELLRDMATQVVYSSLFYRPFNEK